MIRKAKKYSGPITVVLLILALVVGIGTFMRHVQELRSEVENAFKSRNELVQKFIDLQRDRVSVMSNLMADKYAANQMVSGVTFEFHAYPELNVWELTTRSLSTAGTVSGNAHLPLSDDASKELHAAFSLDPQINAALKFDSDIAWIYYQSANNFIYLAPHASIHKFHFTPQVYKQRYWLESLPDVNKERRMILAGPYKDEGGKGWIITFAEPVYYRDTFLGITALDLRVDTLNKLIGVGHATGETMMISENHRLMAKEYGFDSEEFLRPPLSSNAIDWHKDKNGDMWLSSPVVKDELWLAHRVTSGELYRAASRESMATWLMILMLGMVTALGWKLKSALEEVTRITHIDPLTQALNRRGFYEQLEASLALARRNKLSVAVLIMDIDFFKKINDSYGHAVGDSVLKQLGIYLLAAKRPFDLVCRWGGEEFVVVMLLDKDNQAINAAERMRQEAQRTKIDVTDKTINMSGGLVIMQAHEDIDKTISRADLLLYQAKENGRNRIVADDVLLATSCIIDKA